MRGHEWNHKYPIMSLLRAAMPLWLCLEMPLTSDVCGPLTLRYNTLLRIGLKRPLRKADGWSIRPGQTAADLAAPVMDQVKVWNIFRNSQVIFHARHALILVALGLVPCIRRPLPRKLVPFRDLSLDGNLSKPPSLTIHHTPRYLVYMYGAVRCVR